MVVEATHLNDGEKPINLISPSHQANQLKKCLDDMGSRKSAAEFHQHQDLNALPQTTADPRLNRLASYNTI